MYIYVCVHTHIYIHIYTRTLSYCSTSTCQRSVASFLTYTDTKVGADLRQVANMKKIEVQGPAPQLGRKIIIWRRALSNFYTHDLKGDSEVAIIRVQPRCEMS